MNNKKTIHFISDIHNEYYIMKDCLNKSEYDENNDNHLLVVLGDWNDRGPYAVETYKYLKRLTDENKAIVIVGNHQKFLQDFLEGSNNPFNYINNGLDETLADFLGRTKPFESWCIIEKNGIVEIDSFVEWAEIARKEINEEYPELLPWLKSLPRFFESKNLIGVHASIDTEVEDWHFPHCERYNLKDWDALDFDDGSFFGKSICNTNKTIIIGHFGTRYLRQKYYRGVSTQDELMDMLTDDSIFTRYDGRVIAIDSTVAISKKINVLVIEDELIEGEKKYE